MSPPSVFPVVAMLIDGSRYREIVLPHYVYSGVLQVSCFSLPVTPWESGEEGGSDCALRCDVGAQIEELS